MGLEINKHLLEQLRLCGVKIIGFHEKGEVAHIEFFPATPEVQNSGPMYMGPLGATDMPPDDVMLFAATEDPEEALKAST